MLARDAGCIVSSNIAPSTSTVSVTQNKQFGMVYAALHNFKPYEVPGPETSNAVMTALLIHDLNEPMHAGHPDMPLASPLQIFSQDRSTAARGAAASRTTRSAPAVLIFYLNVLVRRQLSRTTRPDIWLVARPRRRGVRPHRRRRRGRVADGGVDAFGTTPTFYQNLAALEIVHAYLEMVRSGLANTAMQIFAPRRRQHGLRHRVAAGAHDAAPPRRLRV